MAKKHKQENRFRKWSQLSEPMFLKVLYYWLSGATISAIPKLAMDQAGAAEHALAEIKALIPPFDFPEQPGEKLSRQSCHDVISFVAEFIICAAYVDKRDAAVFDNVNSAFDRDPESPRYKRFIEGMSPAEIRQYETKDGLKPIEEFKENWSTIIFMLSADKIPYALMNDLGLGDFEKTANPMIVRKMRDRYKRFRGYKREAMGSHVALHFAWLYGLNQMSGNHGLPGKVFFLDTRNSEIREQDEFFRKMIIQSLLTLMMMLIWDCTYDDLIQKISSSQS